jgi:photosystem II stability/assembly factor-like uncharacterized protein
MFQPISVKVARCGFALALVAALGMGTAFTLPASAADASRAAAAAKDPFADPLEAPAVMHPSLAGRPLMAIARAGQRLVAVGMRGVIAVSDDDGATWVQAKSPVRSDLLALSFPTPTQGWAVGHDGVVLHTADGGRSWVKQFDGRMAATALAASYKTRIAAGEASLQPYVDQLAIDYRAGPSLPLLSVRFADPSHGMAVGAFGIAIATDDGGASWKPILDRIDNPQFLHLNAIREAAGNVYIVGEKGSVFRLDRETGRFHVVSTGYEGSFFGLAGNDHQLLAYGLRGTIYASTDQGSTWRSVTSPLHGTVMDAVWLAQRRAFVFATAAGELVALDEQTNLFHALKPARPAPFTGLLASPVGGLLLCGLNGMSSAALQ